MNKLPLNLIYLKYFCDAVKFGSISASAKANFVSQSAISQGIAKLEEGLGYDLLTHQPNRFHVTYEGQRLFESSKAIFESIKELEHTLFSKPGVGHIDFACTHSFALALLPKLLRSAREKWPNLHINFRLGHTDIIKDWLKKGVIDFGIVLDNEDLSAFDCEELYQGAYQLYAAASNKSNEDLSFILSEERSETSILKRSYEKKYKKPLPVLMEVSSWEIIATLAEEGLGIGFFPDYVALRRQKYLKPYPLKIDPIPYKIYAIFPRKMGRNPNVAPFLRLYSKIMSK